MTRAPILTTDSLSKRFGGLQAVDRCDLSVLEGSITGLIGPNGAGKSTAFNLVTGFVRPDGGEVRFAGARIDGKRPSEIARCGLSRTFQTPRELKRLTVLENLLLVPQDQRGEHLLGALLGGARTRDEERSHIARAGEVLEAVGLSEKADGPAGLLSGGQKKLLELARCMMARPRLVLLDEPTAGVNPTLIRHIMGSIRELHASGITLLIIEHNMNVIMELCERVIVMDRGGVLAAGTPAEIQTDPAVLAAYLGGPA
jgi:ABC-type branched-subunit amino acid transport system ATPase component